MYVYVLASLFWGISSTCLIWPWFWINLVNKDIWRAEGKMGFNKENFDDEVGLQIFYFIFVFCMSLALYYGCGFSLTFWGSLFQIMMCLFFQMMNWLDDYKLFIAFFLFIFVIYLAASENYMEFRMRDPLSQALDVTLPTIEMDNMDNNEDGKNIAKLLNSYEISTLFGVDDVEGPYLRNGKYLYISDGGVHKFGVIVIDKTDITKAKFIPIVGRMSLTKYWNRYMHFKHPSFRIFNVRISITEDNVPYIMYGTAERGVFTPYHITSYLLVNMVTGEEETLSIDQVPEFILK